MAGASPVDPADSRVNWLGHKVGTAADAIDRLLAAGATMAELLTTGRTPRSVKNHLGHLEIDHDLVLVERDGKLAFLPLVG
jgi:hypothetical protein